MCSHCKISCHTLIECRKFKSLPNADGRKYAKDNKVCYRCMNHKWGEPCISNIKCKKFSKNHHEILHLEWEESKKSVSTKTTSKAVTLALTQIRAKAVCVKYILLRAPKYKWRLSHGNLWQTTKFDLIFSVTCKVTTSIINLERFWELKEIQTNENLQEDDKTLKNF